MKVIHPLPLPNNLDWSNMLKNVSYTVIHTYGCSSLHLQTSCLATEDDQCNVNVVVTCQPVESQNNTAAVECDLGNPMIPVTSVSETFLNPLDVIPATL